MGSVLGIWAGFLCRPMCNICNIPLRAYWSKDWLAPFSERLSPCAPVAASYVAGLWAGRIYGETLCGARSAFISGMGGLGGFTLSYAAVIVTSAVARFTLSNNCGSCFFTAIARFTLALLTWKASAAISADLPPDSSVSSLASIEADETCC